jgi:hypothetical protein
VKAALATLDLTELGLLHVDLDAIVARLDLDRIASRIDPDAVVAPGRRAAVPGDVDPAGMAQEVIAAIDVPELLRESSAPRPPRLLAWSGPRG